VAVLKAQIDLKAFRGNFRTVQKIVGGKTAILPILKSDAYGHGAVPLARESLKLGAPMLGIGTVAEGVELRHAKIASPILIIDGIFRDEAEEAVARKLTPVVFSEETAEALNQAGSKAGRKVGVHLKFDTGMSRLGFPFGGYAEVLKKIKKLKNIQVEGIMTHLASAPDRTSPQTELQLSRFDAIIEKARAEGYRPRWIHSANSGGILNFPQSRYNMVRPGIILYGVPPCSVRGVSFKQVMMVTGRLVSVKQVTAGEGVGYNATYVTPRAKRIGVVMGGYADGVMRAISNRGSALWNSRLLPILGNVCMDNFMVDLSRAAAAKPGDEVTLIGPQHDKISARCWADLCGTVPYEILCSLGRHAEKSLK